MKESDLYVVLAKYYSQKGYEVKGEVCGCDFVGIKKEEIIIVELKKQFNVKLLYQATRRLAITPKVYMAIFKPGTRQKLSHWTMLKSLSRRLQLGLIIVDKENVKILAEPEPFNSVKKNNQRIKLLKEFSGRKAGNNLGGINKTKLETAYLESAIHIAVVLTKRKTSSASELLELGTPENTYQILYNNHYDWFERIEKGIYTIKKGKPKEIKRKYPGIWEYYRINSIKQRSNILKKLKINKT